MSDESVESFNMSIGMSNRSGRLRGRRILITGAGSGIGKKTAEMFASEGARLALLDLCIEELNGNRKDFDAHVFEADVSDEISVSLAVEQAASAMGGIDGVVNAAGIMHRGYVDEVDASAWRRIIDVNLTGTYIVVRSCLPWLKKSHNSTIVNIGSGQSLLPNSPARTAYAASKGGVVNLTRALAAELAPAIRVNSVCPGLVNTPMAEGVKENAGNYALKRLAEPVEIVNAIMFLTCGKSSFITGAALAVDGGRSYH